MSTFCVWLVKLACLAGSAISTWYFLETVFPPSLFSIVPIGWACFEIGVLLWPKYAFSREARTIWQRRAAFAMTFVSYLGCAACFVANIEMLGPDSRLFALDSGMKTLIVRVVEGDILLTILVALLVTSVIPYLDLLENNQDAIKMQSRINLKNGGNQLELPAKLDSELENNQDASQFTHNLPQAGPNWGGTRKGAGRKKEED